MNEKVTRAYTPQEEVWNCITHGLGIALGIAALTILTAFSVKYGDVWMVVSTVIFGVSMIIMYTASTLYHAMTNEKAKRIFKKFDHIAIYYLIAGSYTPFLLVVMRGPVGWSIFGMVWGLALAGTILKLMSSGSGTKLWSISLYMIMGWMIVLASKQLFAQMNSIGLTFLILGGLFYTLGVFFYLWKSKKYTHAIWHFMVLIGTIMHFFAILYGVVLAHP